MKNKTSAKSTLFLMELIVSILFFSISSAICAGIFAKSAAISEKSKNISSAVSALSSAASCYKAENGNIEKTAELLGVKTDNNEAVINYDANWTQTENEGDYFVHIVSENSFSARIYACDTDGNIFADITVAAFGGE